SSAPSPSRTPRAPAVPRSYFMWLQCGKTRISVLERNSDTFGCIQTPPPTPGYAAIRAVFPGTSRGRRVRFSGEEEPALREVRRQADLGDRGVPRADRHGARTGAPRRHARGGRRLPRDRAHEADRSSRSLRLRRV